MTRKIVLTGGPSSGKSTLLRALGQRGFYVVPEAAQQVIALEQAKGNLEPWKQRDDLQRKIYAKQMEQEKAIPYEINVAILDRGVHENLAYYLYDDLMPPTYIVDTANQQRYCGVLVTQMLPTYEQTEIRKESREEAIRVHGITEKVYEHFGHHLLRLPPVSIDERVELAISHIKTIIANPYDKASLGALMPKNQPYAP